MNQSLACLVVLIIIENNNYQNTSLTTVAVSMFTSLAFGHLERHKNTITKECEYILQRGLHINQVNR